MAVWAYVGQGEWCEELLMSVLHFV